MAHRKNEHASVVYKGSGGAGPGVARAIVVITCLTAIVAVIQGFRTPVAEGGALPPPLGLGLAPSEGTSVPASEEMSEGGPRVGIVAGHWGYDEGTVCDDGLMEVNVNLSIAERVVESLRGLGYQVDLLQEYDGRLEGYRADGLVSIHADSCQHIPNASPPPTGFKVASVVDSVVPEEERRLVECLTNAYAERTGLPFHENSITGHMTGYHTFYAIDGETPGAIIETGFLWLDRDLLTQQPDLVAQGIVDGIVCFVGAE